MKYIFISFVKMNLNGVKRNGDPYGLFTKVSDS